jgi:hypothetical protein
MNFTQPGIPAIGAVVAGKAPGVSMSYHADGKRLFVASDTDARLQIIDCINGKAASLPLRAERERIHIVEATYVCRIFILCDGAANIALFFGPIINRSHVVSSIPSSAKRNPHTHLSLFSMSTRCYHISFYFAYHVAITTTAFCLRVKDLLRSHQEHGMQ